MNIKDEKAIWRILAPKDWPGPPAEMSVSTYVEIEECPRRWALGAANYPDIWSGRGYPPKLQTLALGGSVVHLALELITKRLTRAGVHSLNDPTAPQLLKEMGGYTRIVEDCVERTINRFRDNPRALQLLDYAKQTLRGQVPALRARVQSMLARLQLTKVSPQGQVKSVEKDAGAPVRGPLVYGMHSEKEVHAKSIRWKGKIDLLLISDNACEITDFKTGAAEESHKFQIRVYAVLWRFDDELNPSGRLADRLLLAYENQHLEVEPPSALEIENLGRELLARRRVSEAALAARPPSARPSTETCRGCGVRQLCDEYWASASHMASENGFGDVELLITGNHGQTSWDAMVVRARDLPAKTSALLRLQQSGDFKKGTRVRILDGRIAYDPEDVTAPAVVTLGTFSEVYIFA